jgi:hypothetical protein
MANVRRTARGEVVDVDMLRLANEEVIAVGNMRTNARGDELGPGGKVVKTRAQVMKDYHKLNTPVADDTPIGEIAPAPVVAPTALLQPTVEDTPVVESTAIPAYVKPRGSFADSVAKETEVTQELLNPAEVLGKDQPKGITRI